MTGFTSSSFFFFFFFLAVFFATTVVASVTTATTTSNNNNKFGLGTYALPGDVPPVASTQLPWVQRLAGEGGWALVFSNLEFQQNGNASSCVGGCLPTPDDVASVKAALALGLQPVVRLGQWPRTIRDFSDDSQHHSFKALGAAYRTFVEALPRPPDGSPLRVLILNEPNVCGEWQCTGDQHLASADIAAEAGPCIRDILEALSTLPGLELGAAPTAYAAPAWCPCGSNDKPPHVNYSMPNDIEFMGNMLKAAPDLYAHVDFFSSHPYPWSDAPFSNPLGRAGVAHYQTELQASGRPELPVLITETGWRDGSPEQKAQYITAAYSEVWLPDPSLAGVMPFLAAGGTEFPGFPWVQVNGSQVTFSAEFNATRALRCSLGVGGKC